MEQQGALMSLKYLNSFPPGYRFCPTDEELVLDYLKNKVENKPLPPNKILDINLYAHVPQDLSDIYRKTMCIEHWEKIMYFFTPRDRKYPKGTRPNRANGFGYWKATGVDTIIGGKTNPIGYRKSLVYYQGTSKISTKTDWLMHEYRIEKNGPSCSTTAVPNDMKLDDWVLCKVYLKEKKSDKNSNASAVTEANIIGSSSCVKSPMQSNYHYNYDVASTSFASPPLQPNNFGSTSSAAVPQMEATNNYDSSMHDQQLIYGFDYPSPFTDPEEDLNYILAMIDSNSPPTLDDDFKGL